MLHLRTAPTRGLICFTQTIFESADPLSAGAATKAAPTSPEASAPAAGWEPAVPWDLGARWAPEARSVLEVLSDPVARWACMARSARGATSGEEGLGAATSAPPSCSSSERSCRMAVRTSPRRHPAAPLRGAAQRLPDHR